VGRGGGTGKKVQKLRRALQKNADKGIKNSKVFEKVQQALREKGASKNYAKTSKKKSRLRHISEARGEKESSKGKHALLTLKSRESRRDWFEAVSEQAHFFQKKERIKKTSM